MGCSQSTVGATSSPTRIDDGKNEAEENDEMREKNEGFDPIRITGGPPKGPDLKNLDKTYSRVNTLKREKDSASAEFKVTITDKDVGDIKNPPPQNDSVGSTYVPPPGGRQGQSLAAGGPPSNLESIPFRQSSKGRVERDEVVLLSGAIYLGQWRGNKRDGAGKLIWPDGSEYEGQFSSDEISGKGIWMDASKKNQYEGDFSHNRCNGKGKFLHEDGSMYEGNFVNDMKHGKAKETWPDGTTFDGNINEGSKDGNGHIKFPNGDEYIGQFSDDQFSGKGKYRWKNGREYDGDWVQGAMNGIGTYKWIDGQYAKYIGPYFDHMKQGHGTLFARDGRKIEGKFCQNKMDGIFTEVWPDGKKREGKWEKGVFKGWIGGKIDYELKVDDEDDGDDEYQTTVFSNPQTYHKLYKGTEKKRMKIKGGILKEKMTPVKETKEEAAESVSSPISEALDEEDSSNTITQEN